MRTIDEIRIEGEEGGWYLVLWLADDMPRQVHAVNARYRIGLPDQFKAEVDRTIGAWLDEGERARAEMPARTASGTDDDAYEPNDPKRSTWGELD